MNKAVAISAIQKRFPDLVTDLIGNPDTLISEVSSPEAPKAGSLLFITEEKFLESALNGSASCLVVNHKLKSEIENSNSGVKTFLFSKNVKLAMAKIKKEFFAFEIPLQELGTIHPTAIIDSTVSLGENVSVGPYTVIGKNVTIGDGVRIDAAVIIEADCKIGKDSHLYSQLYIGPRTEIGERCEILPNSAIGSEGFGFAHDERGRFYRIPQTGKVVLQNDVEVGSNSTIDRAAFGVTLIGEGTKIDKLAHIAHNCEIGKHCILAGKFAVAGSTKIGDHFMAGGRVTVRDGITITSGVEVAALSGVHTHVTEPGQYGGFPVQPVRDAFRTSMSLPHLPQMRKDLSKLLKHVFGESKEL